MASILSTACATEALCLSVTDPITFCTDVGATKLVDRACTAKCAGTTCVKAIDAKTCCKIKPVTTLCVREHPETCRGSPTKLVEINYAEWGIPVMQSGETFSTNGENELVLSAFGDTDGDGDVDMVGLVCYAPAGPHGRHCSANLTFYENMAGNIPGTPPQWTVREPNYWKGDLSEISPPGFCTATEAGTGYCTQRSPGFNYGAGSKFVTLVDHDQDGDLDLMLNVYDQDLGTSVHHHTTLYFENIGNSTAAKWVPAVSPSESFASSYAMTLHAVADMDADGDMDSIRLANNKLRYFENVGNKTSADYQDRGAICEQIYGNSVVLHDIDNDGDFDLLVGLGSNQANVVVYENTGYRTEPAWTKTQSYEWLGLSSGMTEFSSSVVINQIIDLDLDGMDDFVYRTGQLWVGGTGGKMKFFRRIKVTGPERFSARTGWHFGADASALESFDSYEPSWGGSWNLSPVGVDLNGDGLQDIVVGLEWAPLLYYQQTGVGKDGIEYAEVVALKDKNGQLIGAELPHRYSKSYRPTFLDIDQDGDYDLILGTYEDGILFYKNTGVSPTVPQFERQTSWVLDQVCIRNAATPTFWHYCAVATGNFGGSSSGLGLDLLTLGAYHCCNPPVTADFMYQYLSTSAPEFTPNTDWDNNGLPDVEYNGGIAFGDVDLDGDDDAIVGKMDGTLEYYDRVQVSPPKWEKRDATDGWSLANIDIGKDAKPTLFDYDNDGDLDLIVGGGFGKLLLFEQGACAGSCTTTGHCNLVTEYMPTCTCSFEGATKNQSCNSW